MKASMACLGFIIVLMSCAKKSETTKVFLNLTKENWITSKNGEFRNTKVILSGTTNADKLTVETYGDGVLDQHPIVLDSKKSFSNDTVAISFQYLGTNPYDSTITVSTKVRAYKGSDTLVIDINNKDIILHPGLD